MRFLISILIVCNTQSPIDFIIFYVAYIRGSEIIQYRKCSLKHTQTYEQRHVPTNIYSK